MLVFCCFVQNLNIEKPLSEKSAMKYCAFLPPLITLYLIIRCVAAKAARNDLSWRKAVYLPNLLFWVSLLGNLFVIPSVLLLWQEDTLGFAYIAFSLMGWSMQLAYANCWIRYDEQGFTHHTFFGRTYEFTYPDVTGIRNGSRGDLWLYCERHMIFLDGMCVNMHHFLQRVKKHSCKLREKPSRIRWDPFNHNVEYGKFIFFLFLILLLLWTAFMPMMLIGVFGPPDSEADTERREAVFLSWRDSGSGDLYMTASDGSDYGIKRWIRLPEQPDSFCDGKTVCTVWGNGSETFWISQLQAGDRTLFSFAQAQEDYKNDQKWAVPLLLLTCAASWIVFIGMLLVGRHPERYSPRIKRLLLGSALITDKPARHRKQR